jgi:hypothetical protein
MTIKIIIIAFISILIVFFILKRLFKLLLFVVLIFGAYLLYVKLTGGDTNKVIKDTKSKVTNSIDNYTK